MSDLFKQPHHIALSRYGNLDRLERFAGLVPAFGLRRLGRLRAVILVGHLPAA